MLPRFETVGRRRPVDLVAPGSRLVDETHDVPPGDATRATPHPAPYAAVLAVLGDASAGVVSLDLIGADGTRLTGWYDGARDTVGLEVVAGGETTVHRSRRAGSPDEPVRGLALTLTNTHLTVLSRDGGDWTARGRHDLRDRIDTRDEKWLAALGSGHRWQGGGGSPVRRFVAGGFGQVGLRDLRLVSHADGSPYRTDGRLLLTATSAGPGFFDTAHTSVWSLQPGTWELAHRADLFFRRPDRPGVFGDHATHLVRDGDRWLVATSTWADFDRRRNPRVRVTRAEGTADLLDGRHVLDTRPLDLPTGDTAAVGAWDPHLVRIGEQWHVGFVSATRFFRFHPALATGPSLDALTLRAAATDRVATEGTTLVELDDGWRVLASDGRDGRPGRRRRFPVLDLELADLGELDAPYPSNLPWPTLVRDGDEWLMVTFDGTPYGGPLVGYGSHGDVVLARTGRARP